MAPEIGLTLYSRAGCHLCDDMRERLEVLADGGAFRLTLVDVDEHAQLRAHYGDRVPVLVGERGEICHFFLDEQALERYVASA